MALTLREERIISGKGVLKIPSNALGHRYYLLYVQVVRRPKNEYRNLNYNPYKSRYANLVFRRKGYVVEEHPLEYLKQQWSVIPDVTGQALIAIKCAYKGVLQSFVNQNVALGLFVTGVINTIEDYTNLDLGWDEILVSCYADTAISLKLYSEVYYTCDPEEPDPDRGGDPPPDIPEVPPGTAIQGENGISPPYEGDNDGGNTEPFPDDEFPEPPPEEVPCTEVIVTYRYTLPSFGTLTETVRVYAPADDVRIQPDNPTGIQCYCRGVAPATCLPEDWYGINSTSENLISVEFVSVSLP